MVSLAGWLLAFVISGPAAIATAQPETADSRVCEMAAKMAETNFGLPPGMLQAIGRVESGDWPWSANVDGVAEVYQSKEEAITALMRIRSPRPTNVDIGCFQISSRFHPTAFATVSDALDPDANAAYAARFLLELRERTGDWTLAAGAYHSATENLAAPYRGRVLAYWKDGDPKATIAVVEQPRWRVISIGPAVAPAVAVWSFTPGSPNADLAGLPRVITR